MTVCINLLVFIYKYVHVVCTMHNEECHMILCLFYPNFKLETCYKYFLKNEIRSHEGRYHDKYVSDGIGCIHT